MGQKLNLPLKTDTSSSGARYTLEESWNVVCEEVYDFAAAFVHFFEIRFFECKSAPVQGEGGRAGQQTVNKYGLVALELKDHMLKCLDLRKYLEAPLIKSLPDYKHSFSQLYAESQLSGVEFGSLDVLEQQLEILASRLAASAKVEPFSKHDTKDGAGEIIDNGGWFDVDGQPKSGTVIMKCFLHTHHSTLGAGCGDFLHFFVHCALKMSNEAVVEGMCGCIAKFATKGRASMDAENYAKLAFLKYNGPELHEADDIIRAAFDSYFRLPSGEQKPWHFEHTPNSIWKHPNTLKHADGGGEVIKRLMAIKSKFPVAG